MPEGEKAFQKESPPAAISSFPYVVDSQKKRLPLQQARGTPGKTAIINLRGVSENTLLPTAGRLGWLHKLGCLNGQRKDLWAAMADDGASTLPLLPAAHGDKMSGPG